MKYCSNCKHSFEYVLNGKDAWGCSKGLKPYCCKKNYEYWESKTSESEIVLAVKFLKAKGIKPDEFKRMWIQVGDDL